MPGVASGGPGAPECVELPDTSTSLRRAVTYHRPAMPASRRPRRRAPIVETPVEQRAGEALVWTDGACSGNPGPGGWAAIVVPEGGGAPVELSGGEPATTNNRMEYTAALEGLRSLRDGSRVCVVTDSQLMLNSMTTWIAGWKRKGWKTAGGQPVKNQDLVKALDAEIARHAEVRWHWVRGHETGSEHAHKALNDRADRLAVAAAAAAHTAA
jgi:ribonuclease HI